MGFVAPEPKTFTVLLPAPPAKITGALRTADPLGLAYRLSVSFPGPPSMVVAALVLVTLKVSLSPWLAGTLRFRAWMSE